MLLKRPNQEPCFFCDKPSRVAAQGSNNKILSVCRGCCSEVFPELLAEASWWDIQNETLMPDTKDQNRSMPREYALKWDLLGNKYTHRLLELAHGYDEYVFTENGPMTEEAIEKFKALGEKFKNTDSKNKKGKKLS